MNVPGSGRNTMQCILGTDFSNESLELFSAASASVRVDSLASSLDVKPVDDLEARDIA